MSMPNEFKIAIVGPADTISGLRALGVEAFDATTGEAALEQLRTIKSITLDTSNPTQYAVVCVIESLLTNIDQAEYAKVVAGPLPAVVLLPGSEGSSGVALARLRSLAEKAVGSSII